MGLKVELGAVQEAIYPLVQLVRGFSRNLDDSKDATVAVPRKLLRVLSDLLDAFDGANLLGRDAETGNTLLGRYDVTSIGTTGLKLSLELVTADKDALERFLAVMHASGLLGQAHRRTVNHEAARTEHLRQMREMLKALSPSPCYSDREEEAKRRWYAAYEDQINKRNWKGSW